MARRDVLWTPLYSQGQFAALRLVLEPKVCLPLFSSPSLCQAWIDGMGFTDVVVPSAPLFPRVLVQMLEVAKSVDFSLVTLDPPYVADLHLETTDIDNLLAQAIARTESRN